MDQNKEKLNRFISAVNSETDKRVSEILSEAEAEKQRILNEADEAAKQARERHIGDSSKMSAGKYVRMVSKTELDMKKEVLMCREKLTAELFKKVEDKISEFKQTDGYAALILKQIAEENPGEGAVVCLSPEDMRLADIIRKSVSAEGVEVSADDSIKLGGFFILRRDESGSGTITDRTFDCAMKEQRSKFSARNIMTGSE
ncbi:MAG: V-type ATP synthase subunit E [Huintestinicola sp.]